MSKLYTRKMVDGAARAMFVTAWASAWEQAVQEDRTKRLPWHGGMNLEKVAPATPAAVRQDAEVFMRTAAMDNKKYNFARVAHSAKLTEHDFGWYLAMEGMGHGTGLYDYIDHGMKVPMIEPIVDIDVAS